MKSKFLLVIIFSLFVNSSFGQKKNAGSTIIRVEKEEQYLVQLKNAIKAFDSALMMKNVEMLKRILSDKLEVTHSNGMVENKKTLLSNLSSGKLIYKTIEQIEEPQIKSMSKPWIAYKVQRKLNVKGVLNEKKFNVQLTTNEYWRRISSEFELLKRESKNRE